MVLLKIYTLVLILSILKLGECNNCGEKSQLLQIILPNCIDSLSLYNFMINKKFYSKTRPIYDHIRYNKARTHGLEYQIYRKYLERGNQFY